MQTVTGTYSDEVLEITFRATGGNDRHYVDGRCVAEDDWIEDVEIEEVNILGVYCELATLPPALTEKLYELHNEVDFS